MYTHVYIISCNIPILPPWHLFFTEQTKPQIVECDIRVLASSNHAFSTISIWICSCRYWHFLWISLPLSNRMKTCKSLSPQWVNQWYCIYMYIWYQCTGKAIPYQINIKYALILDLVNHLFHFPKSRMDPQLFSFRFVQLNMGALHVFYHKCTL